MNSLLIEASAGSGKTFQLSNRFIALLALEERPGDLIALTFTRKAAGEFARRILNRLAKGASSEAEAAKLAQEITPTLIGDAQTGQPGLVSPDEMPSLGVERFQELLGIVVEELDRLQLSTLDSFFTRLVRSSGPELGITGFEMLDESAHKLEQQEILSSVLNSDQLSDKQREIFLQAFEFATFGKEEMKIGDLVMEFIENHHNRYLQAGGIENWGNAQTLWGDDFSIPEAKPEVLAALASEIRENLPDVTHKSLLKWFGELSDQVELYQPGTSFKALPRIATLFEKAVPILDDMRAGGGEMKHYKAFQLPPRLARAFADLIDLIARNEIGLMLTRTQGLWAVISAFEGKYNEQARKRGRLGFSDVSLLLQNNALLSEKIGFNQLAYRLDSKFKHWMLDEFQDTSRQQFDVIEPVVSEAVSDPDHQRSLFVVGDTKQAIYGWRSGEPRLMQDLRDRPDWPSLKDWTMSKSYRSSQSVLEFVNFICNPQGEAMQSLFPEAALQRWRFDEHDAAFDLTGHAAVYEVPADAADDVEGSSSQLATLAILEQVQPVERGLSCAILVGSNNHVAQTANFLRKHSDWPVDTDATVPVSEDNPVGLALLDWFRFLVHPGDDFAKRHIELSPLLQCIDHLGDAPSHAWAKARKQISSDGVASHLSQIATKIRSEVALGDFQEMRLQQILDAAREFDARGGKLEDWLKQLSTLTRSESSKAGSIQVMTVHKSKGLEFDLVILPELKTTSFDSTGRMPVLVQENEQHLPEHYLLRPSKEIVAADPVLVELRDRWIADNCFERFCNLYVALTRAARSVICLVPPRAKSAKEDDYSMNPSGWIHKAVGDTEATALNIGDEHALEVSCLYQNGEPDWYLSEPITNLQSDDGQDTYQAPHLPPAGPRQANVTASGDKGKADFSHRSTRDSRSGMAFGNEVHALFEDILRWEGQPLPPTEAGKVVQSCLEMPESKDWFQPADTVEILNEQAIEAITNEGAWFSGIIDRLMIDRDTQGRATRLRVLDFKTDSVATPEELINRYQKQLKAYALHLAAAEQLDIGKVETWILSTHLQEYVRVL